MHVFWRVLQHAVAPVVVFLREHRQRLIPPPARREHQGVPVLKDLGVPAVPLETQVHEPNFLLALRKASDEQRR